MITQAVLFNKEWTCSEARKWLRKHNYKPIKKVHKTDNYLRYRLHPPEIFKEFVTKKSDNGIVFIIGTY